MSKSIVAIFFSLLFLVLVSAPTIATVLDSDYDISILIDSNEEEEKEGKESSKDTEVKIVQILEDNMTLFNENYFITSGFYSNSYSSKNPELLSPPPEYIL